MSEEVEGKAIYADYDYWFSKDHWSIEEMLRWLSDLTPMLFGCRKQSKDIKTRCGMMSPPSLIYIMSIFAYAGDWLHILDKSYSWVHGSYCASELDHFLNKTTFSAKPMDFVQWYVDERYPVHYALTEYLQNIGYEFRHSIHSRTLYLCQLYAKKDILVTAGCGSTTAWYFNRNRAGHPSPSD